ncbi:type IV pilin [Methanomicrobium mobile]|uniref:type IV pilin n=1 Tax=Methanomicrobium mobile TaxID=2205 RepID=UPI0005B275E4|nr:type IV pilin [Methanomicrobium mobile]
MYREIRTKISGYHPSLDDGGVSPVVGVMLMLVVTIIVAAVVSGFAAGLGDTAQKAPSAAYQFDIDASGFSTKYTGYPVELRVLAGDMIPSGDLQIITEYTVPEKFRGNDLADGGKVIRHIMDGSIIPFETISLGVNSRITDNSKARVDKTIEGYPFVTQTTGYTDSLFPPSSGFQNSQYFGLCNFETNCVYKFGEPDQFFGFDIYDPQYGFGEGSTVHITVIHKPSHSVIYDKDVVAKW